MSITTFRDTYEVKDLIGRGTHGEVYTATDSKGKEYIIKVYYHETDFKTFDTENDGDRPAMRESAVLFKLKKDCGKYLVCISDFKWTPDMSFLVLDYIPGVISLYDALWVDDWDELDKANSYVIAERLLYGLRVIHNNNIAHRDIKTANVICDKDLNIYYIDFGLSCSLEAKKRKDLMCMKKKCGTLRYMAPELTEDYNNIKINRLPFVLKKADVFALGCVFYELLLSSKIENCQQDFVKGRANVKYVNYRLSTINNSLDTDDEKIVFNLISRMLHPDPYKRATVEEMIVRFRHKREDYMNSVGYNRSQKSKKRFDKMGAAVLRSLSENVVCII